MMLKLSSTIGVQGRWSLRLGITMNVLVMTKRCLRMVKQVIWLYYKSLKVMEFIMELHHGTPKDYEASKEASPHGLPYPCELINGHLYKRD